MVRQAETTGPAADAMDPAPTVSVIVIFLNEERFLGDAISSIEAQTFTDWELLLVDDGSTDGSSGFAQRLALESSDRIRYLEHPGHRNLGMSASRNLGLEHARGEFVAFLDGDDVWLEEKLRDQVALMRRFPDIAMVYGRTLYWHSWTGRPEDADLDDLTEGGDHIGTVVAPPGLLRRFLEDGDIYPCMCSIMVRRAVAEAVDGFVDTFRDANEDMTFHTKIFLEHPVLVADRCWDRYRIHPDSFWVRRRREGRLPFPEHTHPDHRAYLLWTEAALRQRGIDDPDLWRLLNRALWPYRHPRMYRLRLAARRVLDRLRHRLRNRPGPQNLQRSHTE